MKTNFRQLFINSLSNMDESSVKELIQFTNSNPLPCWGAIYKKFNNTDFSLKTLEILIERWIKSSEYSRFLLLLLHTNKDNLKILKIFIQYFKNLPEQVQIYLLCLPKSKTVFEELKIKLNSETESILNNLEEAESEKQTIEARITKLLKYEWAPVKGEFAPEPGIKA